MAGIALSRLHIDPKEFYALTPIEYNYALEDQKTNKQFEIDNEYKTRYEVARYVITHLWNMQGRHVKTIIKDPKRMFPFTWEQQQQQLIPSPKQSAEDMKKILLEIASFVNKNPTK